MRKAFGVSVLMLLAVPALALAKAATPLLVTGPACGPGSATAYPWILFTDTDGDGGYDFMTAGDCNGDVRGRPWNPSIDQYPFVPQPNDVYYGRVPEGTIGVHPSLSYEETPAGLYTWDVSLVSIGPGGASEVLRVSCDAHMSISMACQPDNGSSEELE